MIDYNGLKSSNSDDLQILLDKVSRLRGSNDVWMRRQNALIRHMAVMTGNQRVLSKGECHFSDGHFPAIAVYNPDTDITEAFIAVDDDDHIKSVPMRHFWPSNHLQTSAREVLSEDSSTKVVEVS